MRFTVYIPWETFWIAPLIWLAVGLVLFPLLWWMSQQMIYRNPGEKMKKPGGKHVLKGCLFWPIILPALIWENTYGKKKSRKAMERYRKEHSL